jgi:hypothetical protein
VRFIELETTHGPKVILNVDKIIAITPDDEDNCTAIKLIDTILYVKETPHDIVLKIRG